MSEFLEQYVPLTKPINVADIGAAAIAEEPVYSRLVRQGIAHLYAFEGDERQIEKLKSQYSGNVSIIEKFVSDGKDHTLYLASPISGMTSLLEPDTKALSFFNGFTSFGTIESTSQIKTEKLDSLDNVPNLDFLKMDIQGSELQVLNNGLKKLEHALAIQLEVSFVPLYKNQPCFGDIDLWMRKHGFLPHSFPALKRWSIAPTIFGGNFRIPGNQLLEADVIYIKSPLKIEDYTIEQIEKAVWISHHFLNSVDLTVFFLRELMKKDLLSWELQLKYYESLK